MRHHLEVSHPDRFPTRTGKPSLGDRAFWLHAYRLRDGRFPRPRRSCPAFGANSTRTGIRVREGWRLEIEEGRLTFPFPSNQSSVQARSWNADRRHTRKREKRRHIPFTKRIFGCPRKEAIPAAPVFCDERCCLFQIQQRFVGEGHSAGPKHHPVLRIRARPTS